MGNDLPTGNINEILDLHTGAKWYIQTDGSQATRVNRRGIITIYALKEMDFNKMTAEEIESYLKDVIS